MSTGRNAFAVFLVAAGFLWLLLATGFVPPRLVNALWQLWPLLLIGVGLDAWIPTRRPLGVPFTAIAAAIVLIVAILLPGSRSATGSGQTLATPLDGIGSAVVNLRMPSSRTTVEPTSRGGTLLEVTTVGTPEANLDVTRAPTLSGAGTGSKTVSIRPRGGFPSFGRHQWTLGLTDAVPLELIVDGGSGASTFALGPLRIPRLQMDMGTGSTNVMLPSDGEGYTVTFDGGSGSSRLNVPTGASVDLDVHTRSGASVLTMSRGSDVRLGLRSGSGSVVIDVPDDAPVRLEVEDDGSGGLNVASFLRRQAGSGDTGTWQSANYPNGGRAIQITVLKVGSGSLRIR